MMETNRKRCIKILLPSILILIFAMLLSSCGSAAKNSASATADTGYAAPAGSGYASPSMESAKEYMADESEDYMTEESEDLYAAEEAAAEADYDTAAAVNDSGEPVTAYDAEQPEKEGSRTLEKIVYSCSADLQTLAYDESVKALKEAVSSAGGIIQSETESNNNFSWYYDTADSRAGDNRNLYLTVRIPTGKYEDFVNSLDKFGQVMNKAQSAENISRTYNDKKTYITSLETEQKRLLEMMDKAETIEDMMAVEERLTEVQYQLNQYKTELDAMDMDIAYSTVTITLQEVQKITDRPTSRDSFGTRIRKAFINAWAGFVSFWEEFLFALIYLLPAILLLAVIVLIVLRATRRKRLAHREKKRAEKEMYEDLKRRAEEEKAHIVSSGAAKDAGPDASQPEEENNHMK